MAPYLKIRFRNLTITSTNKTIKNRISQNHYTVTKETGLKIFTMAMAVKPGATEPNSVETTLRDENVAKGSLSGQMDPFI